MTPSSPLKVPDDYLIYHGRSFVAEWYFTEAGKMPARDYYSSLAAVDQERFDDLIVFFCDRPFGDILPKQLYRLEDPDNRIYALKPNAERFFNFTTSERKIIITNAYHKQAQKLTRLAKAQLKVAAGCRADYIRRQGEGNYYGS